MTNAKIVECVPNFSEGKDKAVIDSICSEIKTVDTVEILDVDMGLTQIAPLLHSLLKVSTLRTPLSKE